MKRFAVPVCIAAALAAGSAVPAHSAEHGWYVGTGETAGKAGAYAIQGLAARFIDRIEGSWSNVVGLPISTVYRLLSGVGAGIPSAPSDAIDRVER